MTSTPKKASYGIDGYPFLAGLSSAAAILFVASVVAATLGYVIPAIVAGVLALASAIPASLGFHYVLVGKFRQRDRLLAMVKWRGDELVLDIGTGAGLLMIGAAKRAPSGRCVGVDVWSKTDLSNNSRERALSNAAIEGVADRIEVRDEDARSLSFADASVDVVVSMLCLHNIEERREQALTEIARVLKPGGAVVLSDLAYVDTYARFFEGCGFSVGHKGRQPGTFPFQSALVAVKAEIAQSAEPRRTY